MLNVFKALMWSIVLVPLAIILTAAALYLGCGFLATRAREPCPACGARKLKCINWFRVNPPPNRSYYRCEQCGKEYVKFDSRLSSMVEREESPFKDSEGWDAQ